MRPGDLEVADHVQLRAGDLVQQFLALQHLGRAARVEQRGHRAEHGSLPEGRGREGAGLRPGVVDVLAGRVRIRLRLGGRVRRGLGVRLRDLEVDGRLVRRLRLELHVGLQPLDVALRPGDQAGEPADLLRGGGGLVLALLDLVVRRVRRGRRHGSGGHRGHHGEHGGECGGEQRRQQPSRSARHAAGGRRPRSSVWSPAGHVELLCFGLSRAVPDGLRVLPVTLSTRHASEHDATAVPLLTRGPGKLSSTKSDKTG